MNIKYNITIPKPCHEDWNAMTPNETGRFCSSCTKNVVDFTTKNATEIQIFFIENQEQSVCGRFKNDQINNFNIEIPESILTQPMSFHKAFLLTLFVVMGSTLFSCKNQNDIPLGEVSVVKDNSEVVNRTQGAPIFKKEATQQEVISTKKKLKEVFAKTANEPTTGIIAATTTPVEEYIIPENITVPILDSIKIEK